MVSKKLASGDITTEALYAQRWAAGCLPDLVLQPIALSVLHSGVGAISTGTHQRRQ